MVEGEIRDGGRGVQALRQLDRFFGQWQTGEWSLATLPRDLDIRVVRYHDGAELLGFSLIPERVVAIDERLHGMREQLDVQTHEVGHVLDDQQHPIASLGLCHFRMMPTPTEIHAWEIAGRAAVSGAQYAAIRDREASVGEIALINGVSPSLIRVGCAVHAALARPRFHACDIAQIGAAVGILCSQLYTLAERL